MGSSVSTVARGLLVAVAVLLMSGRLDAQETPAPTVETTRSYRLTWAAPQACPSESDLTSRILRLLATSTLTQNAMEVVISARVEQGADGRFRGAIGIAADGAESLRELEASSCDAVASATALIIATVIDPAAAERAQAAEDAALEPPPAASASLPEADVAQPEPLQPPLASAPPGPPITWSLAALTWGGVAMLPNVAWGLGASLTARRTLLSLGLDVQYWPPQRQASEVHATAGANFDRFSGTARGCFNLLRKRTVVDTCVGLEVIVVRGRGFGDTIEPRVGVHTWLAPMFGAGLAFDLSSRITLVGRYEVSTPLLSRHYFEIEGIGSVYQLPPIGGRAGLGISVTF